MRIAIVHEWLEGYAGSERVTEQLLAMFPGADLFSLVDFVPPENRHFLRGHAPHTSFIQRLPFAKKRFRSYLPLFPFAIQQLDLALYDLVISCSHAVAKGVITSPSQLHLSYVLSPMRYAWDLQGEYLRTSGLEHGVRGWLARASLHRLRQWDVASSHGVDRFVTVSQFVARRIAKAYGREACVIPPPVDTDAFTPWGERENYYLVMARQVPYKRIDLVVQAFAEMPQRRLVVIGEGPEAAKIRRMATKNVAVLGHQPFEIVREHMRKGRAFIYAAIEDFGITLAEAQAAGMPVIALCRGGAEDIVLGLETETPTGVFFEEQTAEAIVAAVERFESPSTESTGGTVGTMRRDSPSRLFAPGCTAASRRPRKHTSGRDQARGCFRFPEDWKERAASKDCRRIARSRRLRWAGITWWNRRRWQVRERTRRQRAREAKDRAGEKEPRRRIERYPSACSLSQPVGSCFPDSVVRRGRLRAWNRTPFAFSLHCSMVGDEKIAPVS